MANFKELIEGDKPVLVDFFAEWCGPCKAMAPVIAELKKAMGEGISIVKIDIDKPANGSVSAAYAVRAVPTLILFSKGEVVWRHSGAMGLQELRNAIEEKI